MTNNNNKQDKKDKRVRNWTFIVYPESAKQDWRQKLDDLHIPWLESPLHDKDVNPDGTKKKSHWHILLKFGSKKSYRQVKNLTQENVGGTNPQKVHDLRGMIRYFIHIDNPEKYQYSRTELKEHCGFDIGKAFASSSMQRYDLIHEMIDFIRDNQIEEVSDLIAYAVDNRADDWFPLLADNSLKIVESFIRSIHFKKRDEREEQRMKEEKQKQLDKQYEHDQKVAERAVNAYKYQLKKKKNEQ
ncbi:replication protein [Ligilactobacillus araffinosus]|uniref:Replication initiation protein n=1 Tax=Ligilactobacillus araffinosus DSM 20653 TaxID=1423820 RepID=A0A0R1ZE48_9LACO|nr:replication protein [Ligilactobacillus araffinosus]KRM53047.1 replication initiation protein [Ligilactobacillus araffinosus DSM 20653]